MSEVGKINSRINRRDFLKLTVEVGIPSITALILQKKAGNLFSSSESENNQPEVNLTFWHEDHLETHRDMIKYKKVFSKADVLVKEKFGWDDELLKSYNNISNGTGLMPEEENEDKVLFNSKKPVFFIDPKADHPLVEESDEILAVHEVDRQTYITPYKGLIEKLRSGLKTEANFHEKREAIWEKQLLQIVQKLKRKPEFKNKDKINILIDVGGYHTRIYQRLSKNPKNVNAESVQRTLDETPFSMSVYPEIMRRYLFLNENPSEENLAKHLLFRLLEINLGPLYWKISREHGTSKVTRFMRKVVEQFSVDEIKTITEKVRSAYLNDSADWDDHKKMKQILNGKLIAKGIQLPTNQADFSEKYSRMKNFY